MNWSKDCCIFVYLHAFLYVYAHVSKGCLVGIAGHPIFAEFIAVVVELGIGIESFPAADVTFDIPQLQIILARYCFMGSFPEAPAPDA